jgi:hypothetical protein
MSPDPDAEVYLIFPIRHDGESNSIRRNGARTPPFPALFSDRRVRNRPSSKTPGTRHVHALQCQADAGQYATNRDDTGAANGPEDFWQYGGNGPAT